MLISGRGRAVYPARQKHICQIVLIKRCYCMGKGRCCREYCDDVRCRAFDRRIGSRTRLVVSLGASSLNRVDHGQVHPSPCVRQHKIRAKSVFERHGERIVVGLLEPVDMSYLCKSRIGWVCGLPSPLSPFGPRQRKFSHCTTKL